MDAQLSVSTTPTPEDDVDAPVLDRLLTLAEVSVLTSLSKTSIYRKLEANSFPVPRILTQDRHGKPTRVAWSALEIAHWREARDRCSYRRSEVAPRATAA